MKTSITRSIVLLGITVFALRAVSPVLAFSDTNASTPFGQAAQYLQDLGIVEGYADGTFRPGSGINRAEFTKIVVGAHFSQAAIADCTWDNPFADVSNGVWYEQYVCMAHRSGIIRGYADGTYRGGSTINMAEAAKIIVEAFDMEYQADAQLWYRGYILALGKAGAIPPTVTSPDQALRRAEMAYIVAQVLRKLPAGSIPDMQRGVSSVDTVVNDIVYSRPAGSDPAMTSLDVYTPANAADLPVVIWMHGGGWTQGDKSGIEEHPHFAEFFRSQGFTLVSINYRLMGDSRSPGTTYKEQAQDLADAVAWTRRNISAYGGSPENILLLGHSAGAHLVSLVGVDDRYLSNAGESLSALRGVIALDVVAYDIPRAIETAAELGYPASERNLPQFFPGAEAQADASPVLHIQEGVEYPPFLIVYADYKKGADGMTVSQQLGADQADRFAAALRGVGAEAVSFRGVEETHSSLIMRLGESDHTVTLEIVDFLSCNAENAKPAAGALLGRCE